jgi:hypothetical protein
MIDAGIHSAGSDMHRCRILRSSSLVFQLGPLQPSYPICMIGNISEVHTMSGTPTSLVNAFAAPATETAEQVAQNDAR